MIGGFLFVQLGGFVRFIYGTTIRKLGLSNSPYYSLKEYIYGSNRKEDEHWDKGSSHAFVNKVVGLLSAGIILFIIRMIARLI